MLQLFDIKLNLHIVCKLTDSCFGPNRAEHKILVLLLQKRDKKSFFWDFLAEEKFSPPEHKRIIFVGCKNPSEWQEDRQVEHMTWHLLHTWMHWRKITKITCKQTPASVSKIAWKRRENREVSQMLAFNIFFAKLRWFYSSFSLLQNLRLLLLFFFFSQHSPSELCVFLYEKSYFRIWKRKKPFMQKLFLSPHASNAFS